MTPTIVTGSDLKDWASRRDAQSQLPRLVRRLILATAENVTRLDFAADEGVHLGGWDGIAECPGGGTFVPAGLSVWELGATGDSKGKADSDYKKRRSNPGEVSPSDATFVFVTPRRWGGKTAWAKKKRTEGYWKDVRAYDADDLGQWLDLAPAVQAWVSADLLGRPSRGVRDPERAWRDWSDATEPPTSPALVIAGRADAEAPITKWLTSPSGTLVVRGESSEEALAFTLAALQRLPEGDREGILSRCSVVDTQDAWEWLAGTEPPLVLVSAFEPNDRLARAVRAGHHVIVPTGAASGDDGVILPRPRKDAAEKALREMGLPRERAREAAAIARRSPLALRRRLSISGAQRTPSWSSPPSARVVLAAVLAGSWNDSAGGDRELLATLSGLPYEEFAAQLVQWASQADPPVRRIGDAWLVAAKEDAWGLLARYLTRSDLDRFRTVALRVLAETDPALDLDDESRPIAGLLGVRRVYSGFLSDGIADTLALMGALGETSHLADGSRPDDTAAYAVREALARANADGHIWITNERRLPRLAEAAPSAFLDAVDAGLQGNDPPVLRMFREAPGLGSPVSHQAGLLWALEVLAWPQEHLGRAALILARLARLDPGGSTLNRPANSLRDIFLLWHPQTAADLAFRQTVLARIIRDEPVVAWSLLRRLLPELHGSAMQSARPRWRDWVPDEQPSVTYGEIFAAAEWTVEHLVSLAGNDGGRWAELIGHLGNVPPTSFARVVEHLVKIRPSRFGEAGRNAVWTSLRELISWHRRSPDAEWALPAKPLAQLDVLYRRFAPKEPVDRYTYLFGSRLSLLRPTRSFAEREKQVAKERAAALTRIYMKGGADGIRRLIAAAEKPWTVGWALGVAGLLTRNDEDAILGEMLRAENGLEFVRSYVAVRFHALGAAWLDEMTAAVALTDGELGRLLTSLPLGAATWERVAAGGGAVEGAYWSSVTVQGIAAPAEVETAARSLLRFGRPLAAVQLLALHDDGAAVRAELMAQVLEAAVRSPEEMDEYHQLGYELSHLLARLDGSGVAEERIAWLEWQLLPLLRNYAERPPRALHEALAKHPEFFAEVVSFVYQAGNDTDQEAPSESDLVRARLAHELLRSWHTVPGLAEDGTLDSAALRLWVLSAREEVKARRREVGDALIGQVLRYAPTGADEVWPAEPVRDLIEEFVSEDLERGIWTEIINSRGVTMRGLTDGGRQERAIAERYRRWAEALQGRWFRTAALLRSVAESYERDAQREDKDAELNEDYWE